MFPGLNGLQRRSDRLRYLHLQEVQQRFEQAESHIHKRFGLAFDFNSILNGKSDDIYAVENVSIAAVMICAIQVGVADRLLKSVGTPAWLIGCSLGDLARSVTAGAYQFEDAISNHIHFTKSIDGIEMIGANIGVATPIQKPFTSEDFAWFDQIEVDVSELTPRFLNIGGRFSDLEKIREAAINNGWRIMDILRYPAHSRYILPYVQKIEHEFQTTVVQTPKIPIFSSLSARPISNPDELRNEFLKCITLPIPWHRSISTLVSEHKVTKFVNIGPCSSLSRMMGDISPDITTIEADQLVN